MKLLFVICAWLINSSLGFGVGPDLLNGLESKTKSKRQVFQTPTGPISQCLPVPPILEGKSCVHTMECDAPNTILTCDKGSCICPNTPTTKWIRGSYSLNTAWDAGQKKCLSLQGSACDIYAPKVVYCSKGLVCVDKGKGGFGQCSTSGASATTTKGLLHWSFIVSSIFGIYLRKALTIY